MSEFMKLNEGKMGISPAIRLIRGEIVIGEMRHGKRDFQGTEPFFLH